MKSTILRLALFCGIPLALSACGGGGSSTGSSYSGATTQATVTTTNAQALSVDAYNGGQVGAAMTAVGATTGQAGGEAAVAPRLVALGGTIEETVQRILAGEGSGTQTAAGVSVTVSVPGLYGGSLTYSISYNALSGDFSGSMTFSDFRESPNGPSLSGGVTFSGVYSGGQFTTFTISMSAVTVTEGATSYTAGGSIAMSHSGNTDTVTMSVVLKNNATGQSFWVKDYVYTSTTSGTGQVSVTLTGTYYDPVHGYVTISTLVPLTAGTLGGEPTSGQLSFAGAGGSSARLTFTASGYVLEVDTTGSGTYVTVPVT